MNFCKNSLFSSLNPGLKAPTAAPTWRGAGQGVLQGRRSGHGVPLVLLSMGRPLETLVLCSLNGEKEDFMFVFQQIATSRKIFCFHQRFSQTEPVSQPAPGTNSGLEPGSGKANSTSQGCLKHPEEFQLPAEVPCHCRRTDPGPGGNTAIPTFFCDFFYYFVLPQQTRREVRKNKRFQAPGTATTESRPLSACPSASFQKPVQALGKSQLQKGLQAKPTRAFLNDPCSWGSEGSKCHCPGSQAVANY